MGEIKTLSDVMKQVKKDLELYRKGDPKTVEGVEKEYKGIITNYKHVRLEKKEKKGNG